MAGSCCCLFFLKMTILPTPPYSSPPSACGEVNSDGLHSKEKAESTIGREIKIIKTNSTCSQRSQFHNFSASLNLFRRLCGAEQRARAGVCGVHRGVCVCGRVHVHVCVHAYMYACACFVYVGGAHMCIGSHSSESPWGTSSWPRL